LMTRTMDEMKRESSRQVNSLMEDNASLLRLVRGLTERLDTVLHTGSAAP
jgi:hypothetical protein